jgi:hypothetical protein
MESSEKEKFCWTPCIHCGHSVEVFDTEIGSSNIVCDDCLDNEWSEAECED